MSSEEAKKRILFTSHTLDFRAGGAERVLLDILSRLDRERFTPLLAAARDLDGVPAEFEELGIEPWQLPNLPMLSRRTLSSLASVGLALLRLNFSLFRLLKRERVDALYVNSIFALHFAVIPAALTRVPLIYHEHGLVKARQNSVWAKFFPWLMKRVTHTICITDAVRNQLLAELGVPPERTCTVHNGIEMRGWPPPPAAQAEAAASRKAGEFSIAQIANLLPWKGHATVIRAAARLKESLPGLRIVFFGHSKDPDFDAGLHDLAEELDVSESIEFAGFREDALEALREFDCLVLASQGEPFGLVLIEAMRAGIPVIGSNAGGVPEIVTDDVDGLHFEVDDDAGLARQVDRLAHDPALATRLAITGFEMACRRFSIDAQIRGVEELLSQVTEHPAR